MQTNEPINTSSIQQFIQQVKGADMSNQKEVRIPIQQAKQLTYALATILARLTGDYEALMSRKSTEQDTVEVKVDGGKL